MYNKEFNQIANRISRIRMQSMPLPSLRCMLVEVQESQRVVVAALRTLSDKLEEDVARGARAYTGADLNFGAYGLKAMQPGRITARQIEAARRAMTRHMKRAGKVWIRVFPDVPVSSKPAEVRMGKGKGTPEFWIARIKPGRMMFEVDGVPQEVARQAFELAAAKLPIRTKFIARLVA